MSSLKRPDPSVFNAPGLRNKVYVRSTRSGKVQKIVREIYLRRDIPCGLIACPTCHSFNTSLSHKSPNTFISIIPTLSCPPPPSLNFPHGHYIIPDTQALLLAFDAFHDDSPLQNVVILQTVLDQVKLRHSALYHRLTLLIQSPDKHFFPFYNEFHSDTYTERIPGESVQQYTNRCIRRAASWYTNHVSTCYKLLDKPMPSVLLISDTCVNELSDKPDLIHKLKLEDYISQLPNSAILLDRINCKSFSDVNTSCENRVNIYPEHWSLSKMLTGINSGTLYQGTLNVSPYNYLEGTVTVSTLEKPLLIVGRENINRAVCGDHIVVELLPREQWKYPLSQIIDHNNTIERLDDADTEETEPIVRDDELGLLTQTTTLSLDNMNASKNDNNPRPTARVVGILKRNWRQYVGHIDGETVRNSSTTNRSAQMIHLMPMDKRIPKIRIRTVRANQLVGQRLLVRMDDWPRDSRYPIGHFIRSLGALESQEAETEALLLEHNVRYEPFSQLVLQCLPPEGEAWCVPDTNSNHTSLQYREDLRFLNVCSIDPVGCQDIDDALHARRLNDGTIEIGVHIADVSHFVKPDTEMDREAAKRGTTVYLCDKRIDMLPALLGTNLCSLRPNVDRFAFSVIWKVAFNESTRQVKIVDVHFTKSIIKSRMAFSYEQAQARIDDSTLNDELTESMRVLMSISQILRAERMQNGALNLASPEIRIEFGSESSLDEPTIHEKQHLASNELVEEFMLLANNSVAQYIYDVMPDIALLRRHSTPGAGNFDEIKRQLRQVYHLELNCESSRALAQSLDQCYPTVSDQDERKANSQVLDRPSANDEREIFNRLVRIMITRCMTSAEYICAGSRSVNEFYHYGLAMEMYTHFTSPIRRYADLVVHRQLDRALSMKRQLTEAQDTIHNRLIEPFQRNVIESIVDNLNIRHRNAQLAGRASVGYFVGQELKRFNVDDDDNGDTVNVNRPSKIMIKMAIVMRVFVNGIVVYVPDIGFEGVIKLGDIIGYTKTGSRISINARANENSDNVASPIGCKTRLDKFKSTASPYTVKATFDADNYSLKVDATFAGQGKGSVTGRTMQQSIHQGDHEANQRTTVSRTIRLFDTLKVRIFGVLDAATGKRQVRMIVVS